MERLYFLVFYYDWLVLWYQGLHDAPAYQVGYGTDAEHYHIGSRLALETEELEAGALSSCPCKELTRAHVDSHRTESTSHGAQTYDSTDGAQSNSPV